ncbi:hypothetical protein [Ralstonia phage RP31]|uniref:Uncharacterized protein n=2 Tax=Ripduovirus RP12 TaxID=2560700 RepID=A0A1L7N0V2_9CAUD|nr:hypothetical protein FDH28_gp124 [Ralstonia phage RP12]BAW19098.1 hypothetical protein [Ralstonia phage RP12]BAW19384.1 hypothetical protein [Ralstonia phage RP31]
MSQRLKAFDGKRYDGGVMDFMHAAIQEGFDNEFDNSLVLRAMWEKHNLVWSQGNSSSKVYLTAALQADPNHGHILIVTLHSKEKAEVMETLKLFVRKDGLAVLSDVIVEKVAPSKSDLSSLGKSVSWDKAKDVLSANPRFSSMAIAAFEAVAATVKPTDALMPKHIRLKPTQVGVEVAFVLGGKKVLSITIEYSHATQAVAA